MEGVVGDLPGSLGSSDHSASSENGLNHITSLKTIKG